MSHANPGCDDGGMGDFPCSGCRITLYRLSGAEISGERSDWTGMNGDSGRIEHFIAMLDDEDPSRRWRAAETLGRIRDDRAVEPLILALDDEDWRVRQKAAWALGKVGDPRALVPLRRAYRNELEGVKEIIDEAVDEIKRNMSISVRSSEEG